MSEVKKTKFDGRQAKIIAKDHPHYGSTSECRGAQFIEALGKWGMIFFNPNSDEEFFVFNGKDVKWVKD